MELVNEWLTTGKFRKSDSPFRTDAKYEKELMAALPLTGNTLCKAEIEGHGKFGYTIGWIKQISVMIRIDIFWAS